MITLSNVRKEYNSDVAIGPVNLEIPSGGITALVGPNGAGKSTLLTMIGRLLGMDSGDIKVAQYDITTTKSKDLAKILSILRQENHFITKLTVRQLVGFGKRERLRAEQRLRNLRRLFTLIPLKIGLGDAALRQTVAAAPGARQLKHEFAIQFLIHDRGGIRVI